MTTLRESIKDLHDEVEQSKFAKLLLSGNITEEVYTNLLFNMYNIYVTLEDLCNQHGLLDKVKDIERAPLILEDVNELPVCVLKLQKITTEYTDYLIQLAGKSPNLLLAHVYVRHFGDLFGGQIIKKTVPGSGKMYDFENRQELIGKVRSILTDDLGDEAKVAMKFAIDLFKALEDEYNIQ